MLSMGEVAIKHDDKTVFVRNVAFTVDEEGLSAFFSDVGPVKKAILVRPRGSEHHKGYGFVTFSLKEDAAKAATELAGRKLDGRPLKVEIAVKRDSLQTRNQKRKAEGVEAIEAGNHRKTKARKRDDGDNLALAEEAERDPADEPAAQVPVATVLQTQRLGAHMSAADKAELCKAVAVGNIPKGRLPEVLQLARKAGPVTNVTDPIPQHIATFAKLRQDGCDGHSVLIHYETGKAAFLAVWALHGKAFVDSRRGKGGGKLWARQANGEGAQVKKWRIILRNIPFGTSEDELSQLLGKIGFVWSVSIPKKPNGQIKGFAFAAFTCRAHAERAIAAVNGKEYKGRLVVADWSIAKAAYQGAADNAAPRPHEGETYDIDAHTAAATASEKGVAGGASAEDDAADQDDGDSASSDAELEGDGSDASGSDADEDEPESDDDSIAADDDGDGQEDDAAASQEDDAGDGLTPAERGMLTRVLDGVLKLSDPGGGGPAKDATGKGGGQATKSGGKSEPSAKDRSSGGADKRPAGGEDVIAEWEGERSDPKAETSGRERSGEIRRQVFVRNLPASITSVELSARLARYGNVKACRLVLNPLTKKPKGTAFVEFETPAGAQKAAEVSRQQRDGSGPGISIKGQVVTVDMALEQESARTLAKSLSKGEAGKGSKDSRNLYLLKEGLIEEGSELWNTLSTNDQNKRRHAAQEKKLKLKSPNFFVSPTRLHIINIPPTWDEKKLKDVSKQAVLERASKARPKVKQAVILHDMTRLDATGNPKSRGIGFVEFETPEQALVCLRQMNNNPTLFGSAEKRPIVEFAIENVKILKIRERKLRLQKERQEQLAAAEKEEPEPSSEAVQKAGTKGGQSELDAEALRARGLKRKARNERRQRERRLKIASSKQGTELPRQEQGVAAPQRAAQAEARSSSKSRGEKRPAEGEPKRSERAVGQKSNAARGEGGKGVPAGSTSRAGKAKAKHMDDASARRQAQKQQLDAAMDKLADSWGDYSVKRKKRKVEKDDLDTLITKRTRALFGLDGGQKTRPEIDTRWFD